MFSSYHYNLETGKYKKEGEVKTTSCKITELEANTKYTYAISAVKSTDSGVVKSKVRKINFTTPDEWIYYNNSSGK